MPPGSHAAIFVMQSYFCVTHDGLSERGTTCSLFFAREGGAVLMSNKVQKKQSPLLLSVLVLHQVW